MLKCDKHRATRLKVRRHRPAYAPSACEWDDTAPVTRRIGFATARGEAWRVNYAL